MRVGRAIQIKIQFEYIHPRLAKEAKVAAGGGVPKGKGWYVEPTIFYDVDNSARIGHVRRTVARIETLLREREIAEAEAAEEARRGVLETVAARLVVRRTTMVLSE